MMRAREVWHRVHGVGGMITTVVVVSFKSLDVGWLTQYTVVDNLMSIRVVDCFRSLDSRSLAG